MTPVEVHFGPAGPARNRWLWNNCIEASAGPPENFLYVVAGPLRKRQLDRRYLEIRRRGLGSPVTTLVALAARFLTCIPEAGRIIDPLARWALLHEVVAGMPPTGAAGTQASAWLREIDRYFQIVKNQHIETASELELLLRQRETDSAADRTRIWLFSQYQQRLQDRGLLDRDSSLLLAHQWLLSRRRFLSDLYPGIRRLVVEGQVATSPLEHAFLGLLVDQVPKVMISLDCDHQPPQSHLPGRPDRALAWIPHSGRKKAAPQTCRAFAGREEEVWEVGRRILRLHRERGIPFAQMLLVCPQPGLYRGLIEEIFSMLGVPLSGRDQLRADSLFRSRLGGYLELARSEFSPPAMLDFLISGSAAGLTKSELDGIRRHLKMQGPRWRDRDVFRRWLETTPSDWPAVPAGWNRFVQLVRKLYLDTENSRSRAAWWTAFGRRLQAVSGPAMNGNQGEKVWPQMGRCVLRALSVCSSESISFACFRQLVQVLMKKMDGMGEREVEGVALFGCERLGPIEIQALFWLGMNEGTLLVPAAPRYGLSTDASPQVQWEERLGRSLRLFQEISARAGSQVWVSCCGRPGESSLDPSPILNCPPLEISPTPWRVLLDGETVFEVRMNIERGQRVAAQRWAPQWGCHEGVLKAPDVLRRLRRSHYRSKMLLSPSQISEYFDCGFRYWMRRILKLRMEKPATEELTAHELGSLLHRVVHRFVQQSDTPRGRRRDRWLAEHRIKMFRIFRQELKQLSSRRSWEGNLFWDWLQERLCHGLEDENTRPGLLARFVEQQWQRLQDHRVEGLEIQLGPISLGTIRQSGKVDRLVPIELVGTIDRLEISSLGLTLVDYKTGNDPLPALRHGRGFQLPLYHHLLAVDRGKLPVETLIYSLQLPSEVKLRKVRELSGPPAKSLTNSYLEKARQLAAALWSGSFPVTLLSPREAGCFTCDYRSVCRYRGARARQAGVTGQFPERIPVVEPSPREVGDSK